MPAVLIEIGYLSNAEEEKLLTSNAFQGNFAAAVTEAVSTFRDYLEQGPQVPEPPTP
jgi:N-acetylmuramoyl-L-alanine amidase